MHQWGRIQNEYTFPVKFSTTYSATIMNYGGNASTDWAPAINNSSTNSKLSFKATYGTVMMNAMGY